MVGSIRYEFCRVSDRGDRGAFVLCVYGGRMNKDLNSNVMYKVTERVNGQTDSHKVYPTEEQACRAVDLACEYDPYGKAIWAITKVVEHDIAYVPDREAAFLSRLEWMPKSELIATFMKYRAAYIAHKGNYD